MSRFAFCFGRTVLAVCLYEPLVVFCSVGCYAICWCFCCWLEMFFFSVVNKGVRK